MIRGLVDEWRSTGKGWSCNGVFYPLLAFADDLYIVATSAAHAQQLLTELHQTLQAAGMKLQPNKCAWLAVNHRDDDNRQIIIEGMEVPKEYSSCVCGTVL